MIEAPGTFAGINLAASRGERRLFAGLGFSVMPGGALILSGPNGSGKSSLLRLMAGFGRPTGGSFFWNGQPVEAAAEAHRARIHYVGHQDGLKPALTVGETIGFWAALAGHSPVATALTPLGLKGLADRPCRFLSSGQRRRLALSRLAAWTAPLWLLDEPSVGLDLASLEALSALIRGHRADGGSVILSTHQGIDLEGAETLALDAFPPPPLGPVSW